MCEIKTVAGRRRVRNIGSEWCEPVRETPDIGSRTRGLGLAPRRLPGWRAASSPPAAIPLTDPPRAARPIFLRGPMSEPLRVVVLKPSKYLPNGDVERFRRGFMPNSTVPYLRSMTPARVGDSPVEVHAVDEYVHTDLRYLSLLRHRRGAATLLALVGVQSHQFHRALDLAAYARRNGCMAVVGGPHPMTCDTSELHGRGVSFALAEAELVWSEILARRGRRGAPAGLRARAAAAAGAERAGHRPPRRRDLSPLRRPDARPLPRPRVPVPVQLLLGHQDRRAEDPHPVRRHHDGQPAGREGRRGESDHVHLRQLQQVPGGRGPARGHGRGAARDAVLRPVRHPDRPAGALVALLGAGGLLPDVRRGRVVRPADAAGGVEGQNRPEAYREIVGLCREHGIGSHFSNIIGFPRDTEPAVLEHLAALREIDPAWASFYILCPIPGTEQYDDFLARGLVAERNLDRFDGTCLTWRHPSLSAGQLERLLFRCYREFYSWGHAVGSVVRHKSGQFLERAAETAAMTLFNRYCAWRRVHPDVRRGRAGAAGRCG